MYINKTIFKGELKIVTSNNDCSNNEQLDWFINEYEPQIMACLLGEIYTDLLAHTIVSGDKFDKLLNGFVYVVDDKTYVWKGFNYLTACFVYFYYQREQSVITSQFGGKKDQYEKATNIGLDGKMARNWNNAQRLLNYYCECPNNSCNDTLWHFLENNGFEDYSICPKYYEGGVICLL
jgi:hypothetical protein